MVNSGNDIQTMTIAFGELVFTCRTFAMFFVMIRRCKRLKALTVALMRFADVKQKDDRKENFKKTTKCMNWFPKLYYLAGTMIVVKTCLFQGAYQTYVYFNGLATKETFVLPSHTE
jgi:hypothetical protein